MGIGKLRRQHPRKVERRDAKVRKGLEAIGFEDEGPAEVDPVSKPDPEWQSLGLAVPGVERDEAEPTKPPPAAARWRAPSSLRGWEAHPNPRDNESAVDEVAASITRFGFGAPIVALEDGRIIAGETRWKAATRLGLEAVPVRVLELEEGEARAYRLADNRLGELAAWHPELLAEEIRQLTEDKGVDLDGLGWSPDELRDLGWGEGGGEGGGGEGDASDPGLPVEPVSQLGELYQLGPHRLLVGDSTDLEVVARLVGKERARCVFTDPPYAIYGSSSGFDADISDDKLVRPFFRSTLRSIEAATAVFGQVYVCCDWRSWPSWWEVAKGGHLSAKNLLVWHKTEGAGLGYSWGNAHELLGYFVRMPKNGTMQDARATGVPGVMCANVLAGPRARGDDRPHNASKPPWLVQKVLGLSTDGPGDLVVDLFAGGGSTLLAAAGLGLRCYTLEIDPRWADVVRRRWTAYARGNGLEPGAGALDPLDPLDPLEVEEE